MRSRGFTLIELVMTVAIIAVLAAIAAPMAETVVRRSKEQELKAALVEIRTAIDAYKDASDGGRITHAAGESGYPPSLEVLVEGVPDRTSASGAKVYFLRRVPRDPFADASLPARETWGLRSWDSPPGEPKEGKDVFDVRSLSGDKGLDGSAYGNW
jgi:general secretion pathway protein G